MSRSPRTQYPRLSAWIERTQHGLAGARSRLALGPPDPQRHFTPERHGLTQEQCHLANQLLRKADQERPLQGLRRACRIGGILRAVKHHHVGNARYGHHLMGYRGGNVMKAHGLHILREIAPIGSLTARVNREKHQAQEVWERTGEVLPLGAQPAHSQEAQRIQDLQQLWEEQQWQNQFDYLRW